MATTIEPSERGGGKSASYDQMPTIWWKFGENRLSRSWILCAQRFIFLKKLTQAEHYYIIFFFSYCNCCLFGVIKMNIYYSPRGVHAKLRSLLQYWLRSNRTSTWFHTYSLIVSMCQPYSGHFCHEALGHYLVSVRLVLGCHEIAGIKNGRGHPKTKWVKT